MQQPSVCVFVAACALTVLPLCAAADGLTPGLYEYSTTSNLPVAPAASALPAVGRECITERGLGGIDKLAKMQNSDTCTLLNKCDSGDLFSYRFACTGPLKMEYEVRGSATTITINSTVEISRGQSLQTTLTAKRVGDCGE